jgi:hypothetical protein
LWAPLLLETALSGLGRGFSVALPRFPKVPETQSRVHSCVGFRPRGSRKFGCIMQTTSGRALATKPEWEMEAVVKLSKVEGDETAILFEFVKARLRTRSPRRLGV